MKGGFNGSIRHEFYNGNMKSVNCMSTSNKWFFTILMTACVCFSYLVSPLIGEAQNEQRVFAPKATLIKVSDGFRYTEGPAWSPDGKLYFTDRPSSRILTWSPEEGISVFSKDPGGANGLLYGNPMQLVTQLISVLVVGAFAFAATWIIGKLVDVTVGIRVGQREESVGLDISQHGERAYSGVSR